MAKIAHRDHLSGMEGMILNPGIGIAFDIEISECVSSNSPVPKWLRQRLEENFECKAKSLEDIEARLKEADLRRQVISCAASNGNAELRTNCSLSLRSLLACWRSCLLAKLRSRRKFQQILLT